MLVPLLAEVAGDEETLHTTESIFCAAMQELAVLLQKLKSGGHKALIFTQMTKMLDVLEAFLNLHSYTYLRSARLSIPRPLSIPAVKFAYRVHPPSFPARRMKNLSSRVSLPEDFSTEDQAR